MDKIILNKNKNNNNKKNNNNNEDKEYTSLKNQKDIDYILQI